ncbi:MAG: GIY-YIG nuclease family protein [Candidatus Omnitrophica bacterium]|nr:GIY-YIG nuclease family protein [Candidatus Omnitrophota bacterium]
MKRDVKCGFLGICWYNICYCHCEEATKLSSRRGNLLLWKNKDAVFYGACELVEKQYYIYITTNRNNTVLYVGVTNDLQRRVYEHKEKLTEGFTKKYNVNRLVYYEVFEDIENAIIREKQINGGSRAKKIKLIESINKEWKDLYPNL